MCLKKLIYKLFSIAVLAMAFSQSALAVSFGNYDIVTVKRYKNEIVGKGITVKEIRNIGNAKQVGRVFQINVKQAGYYHIACWTRSFSGNRVDVYVNQESFAQAQVEFNRCGWQAKDVATKSSAEDNKLYLKAGENMIVFMDEGPAVPEVEFLRIGKNREDVSISETAHLSRMQKLKSSKGRSVENDTVVTPYETHNVGTKQGSMILSNDPWYDYGHELEKEYKYTYRQWFYLTAGSQAKFESRNGNIGTIVYFFNANDPESASWVGNFDSINVTVPTTGWYMGLVRSYWWDYEEGTCDVYFNDQLKTSNAIVTGNLVAKSMMNSGELNYFSAKPWQSSAFGNDTYIFLSTWRKQSPIAAHNDDYQGSGDFNWGYLSRIKHDLEGWWNHWNRSYIFVHAYSSYSGNGTADFYLMNEDCPSVANSSSFPELEEDDAIKSAEGSLFYNCISWSGGVTDYWAWPLSAGSSWYISGNPLGCFDNFYGNNPPRYQGADTLTRTGATDSNAIVDLWSNSGGYTHGSVKEPGNDYAHGYDWESKPGRMARTFHPRDALEGALYGVVDKHYIPTGSRAMSTLAQQTVEDPSVITSSRVSIEMGLSKLRQVSLSEAEKVKVSKKAAMVALSSRKKLENLYQQWQAQWSTPKMMAASNPLTFADCKEYKAFAEQCNKLGKKAWPFLISKYSEGNRPVMAALEELVYPAAEDLMEMVHDENRATMYDEEGVYTISSLGGNWLQFCKKVIEYEL